MNRLLLNRESRAGLLFDRRYGVETEGSIERDDLTEMSGELRPYAGDYKPSNPSVFERIMRKSRIDPGCYAFVDLGCGKGRIVIAATEYGFRSILGVEADSALYRSAIKNLERCRWHVPNCQVEVTHADARTVHLPEGNLFVFMYSPFRGPIFESVAKRLARIAREPGRAVFIAYSADWEAQTLEQTGAFTRMRMRRRRIWARSTVSFFYNAEADRIRRCRPRDDRL